VQADYIIRVLLTAREEITRTVDSIMKKMGISTLSLGDDFKSLRKDTSATGEALKGMRGAGNETDRMFDRLRRTMRAATGEMSYMQREIRGLVFAFALKFAQPLITALTALVATFGAVAASAGGAAIALGGLATVAITQVVPAIGILVAAFARLSAVIKAVTNEEKANEAAELESAQRKKALQAAVDTLRASEQQLADARKNLSRANREQRDSERQLLRARQEAQRQYVDLMFAEKEAVLARRDAELGLLEAKKRLLEFERGQAFQEDLSGTLREARERLTAAEAGGDPNEIAQAQTRVAVIEQQAREQAQAASNDDLERKRLQLTVDQQELAVKRSRVSETRSSQDAADARRRGVAGSDTMIAARQRLADAEDVVALARRNLANANRDLARSQERLAESQETLTAAQKKAAQELAKLTPAERELAESIRRLRDRYREVMRPITDIMVRSFDRTVKAITDILGDPKVMGAVKQLTGGLATALDTVTAGATSPEARDFWTFMMQQGAQNAPKLAKAFVDMSEAMSRLTRAFSPLFNEAIDGLVRLMDRFDRWTSNKSNVDSFAQTTGDMLKSWWDLLKAVLDLFAAISGPGGAAKEGTKAVEGITKMLRGWADWIRANPTKVQKFFKDSREAVAQLWRVVDALGRALIRVFKPETMKALVDVLVLIVIPAFEDAINIMGILLMWWHKLLGNETVAMVARFAITAVLLGKGIFLVSQAMKTLLLVNPWLAAIGAIILILYKLEQKFKIISRAVEWLKDRWNEDWGGIRTTITRFWNWLNEVFWSGLKKAAQDTWNFINKWFVEPLTVAFEGLLSVVKAVWKDVAEQFKLSGDMLKNAFKVIKGIITGDWGLAWSGLKGIVKTALQGVLNMFDIFANTIRRVWNWLVDKIGILPDGWKIDKRINISSVLDDKVPPPQPTSGNPTQRGVQGAASGGYITPVPGGVYRVAEAGHPEMVIPLDPAKRGRAWALVAEAMKRMGGAPGFALGGLPGSGVLSGAINAATWVGEGIGGLTRKGAVWLARKAITSVMSHVLPAVFNVNSTLYKTGGASMPGMVLKGLKGIIPGFADGGIPEGFPLDKQDLKSFSKVIGMPVDWLMKMLFGPVTTARARGLSLISKYMRQMLGNASPIARSPRWQQALSLISDAAKTSWGAVGNMRLGMTMDAFKSYLFSKEVFNNPLLPYSIARTDHGLGNMSWGLPTKSRSQGSQTGAKSIEQSFTMQVNNEPDIDYVMRIAKMHMLEGY
jgi:hypothetical protein